MRFRYAVDHHFSFFDQLIMNVSLFRSHRRSLSFISEYRPVSHAFVKITPAHARSWPVWKSSVDVIKDQSDKRILRGRYKPIFPRYRLNLSPLIRSPLRKSNLSLWKQKTRDALSRPDALNHLELQLVHALEKCLEGASEGFLRIGVLGSLCIVQDQIALAHHVLKAYVDFLEIQKDILANSKIVSVPFQMMMRSFAKKGQLEETEQGT